jgi:hypothetical protein
MARDLPVVLDQPPLLPLKWVGPKSMRSTPSDLAGIKKKKKGLRLARKYNREPDVKMIAKELGNHQAGQLIEITPGAGWLARAELDNILFLMMI